MENVLPDVFNTPIIDAAVDQYWQQGRAIELSTSDTLVLSTPFVAGSADEVQLLKMLGACKLQSHQYQIFQLAETDQIAWHQLREATKATKVILLGILPAQLGIAAMMVAHEVNQFDAAQWMPTFSLAQIATNDALKKHLWVNVFQKVYF